VARKWREVKQEREDSDTWDRTRRRVARMGTNELLEWVDAAGAGMFKGFRDYRTHASVESLEEIRFALIGVQAIVDELIERDEAAR
jgi:hypothetical protein